MLMPEQGAQARMGGFDRLRRTGCNIDPQRQGVDKHPQRTVCALAGLHTAHQHRAEYHLVAARDQAQHLGPGQVHQAGGTDAQLARLLAYALGQACLQVHLGFFDCTAIALHILQTKRQRRLVDLGEHVAEKLLMLRHTDAQSRLGHIVAKRRGGRQVLGLVEHKGTHFLADHLHGGVVQRQVVEQQDRRDPVVRRVLGIDHAQQRRLGNVQAIVTRIETPVQLRHDVAAGRVEHHLLHRQLGGAPHHLHRAVEPLPHHSSTQNIVARHHLLQRAHKGVQALDSVKGHARLQQVRVALLGADVVVENAFL